MLTLNTLKKRMEQSTSTLKLTQRVLGEARKNAQPQVGYLRWSDQDDTSECLYS